MQRERFQKERLAWTHGRFHKRPKKLLRGYQFYTQSVRAVRSSTLRESTAGCTALSAAKASGADSTPVFDMAEEVSRI